MRNTMVILLVACLLWPGQLAAALDEGLTGRWSGTIEPAGDDGRAQVTLRRSGNNFELDLRLPELIRWQGRMAPAGRPGVFEPDTGGGLFDLFDGGDRANPFDGAPLLWSRTTETGLVVYRLTIAKDGTAELLRVAFSPAADGLGLEIERRLDGVEPEHWRALLVKGS